MRRLWFLFCAVMWVGSCEVWAANIYVDNKLGADITNGTYSIAIRDNSGSDGNAYKTIATAIAAMNGGDDIYIRGGIYYERDIYINASQKNGSVGNYSTIQSYPNEWAVIDGQRLCTSPARAIFTHFPATPLEYWKFERLEITGGGSTTSSDGAGIRLYKSSNVTIRYCYIHDNLSTSHSGNPAGVKANVPRKMLIEYCYFKENGSPGMESGNCANIVFVSDYKDTTPNDFDANVATRENEVRFNLLEGSGDGVKHKNQQIFGEEDRDPLDMTYKLLGDKIHHNIIIGFRSKAINADQDFSQVYNNIVVNREYQSANETGLLGIAAHQDGDVPDVYNLCVYNNTIIRSFLSVGGMAVNDIRPYITAVNNIVAYHRGYGKLSINIVDIAQGGVIDMSNALVSRNYIYDPKQYYIHPILEVDFSYLVAGGGSIALSAFDSIYGYTNFKGVVDGNDLLFKGSSGSYKYKTRPDHTVIGVIKIQNGGTGGAHPYLSGVILPVYIGATGPFDSGSAWDPNSPDPDDAGWVDYVLRVVGALDAPKNLKIKAITN